MPVFIFSAPLLQASPSFPKQENRYSNYFFSLLYFTFVGVKIELRSKN
jgi:hypothetical protein